ncbi:MAG: hypothetical protein ACFFAJ_04750, partial [Candidatus Hodarchaeota archaeon]
MLSGIDEAGRGSVVGPLIIVGVTLNHDSLNNLILGGLKDSKLYLSSTARIKRARLALKIQEIAIDTKIIEISATEIDNTLKKRPGDNLNLLEIRKIGQLVLDLSSTDITIDTLSLPRYSKKHLISYLYTHEESLTIVKESCESESCFFSLQHPSGFTKKILISKKADRIYPIVSAASCVAKHLRDQSLRKIEYEWNLPPNCLGQGYPN